jgi:ABC-2 type transport system ATP-binding protein
MRMADSMIQVDNLRHSYGDRPALADLNLDVHRGEIFGLLGPNGSGKTTLFRILCTLLRIQSGRVTMAGLDLSTEREQIRRLIGIVFQSPSLDKQLTAEENLRHQGHLYGLRGRALEDRIDQMLQRVGLGQRPREYVGQFSGGMRRRVELAKGLLHLPRILLLDEPSTGIDPAARIDLWRYLAEIRDRDNVTILLTTHLMEEADKCDRLGITDNGRCIACGSPTELKSQIGGDVITLTTDQPAALQEQIRQRFGIEAVCLPDAVRIERSRGHEFIPQVVEAFPGMIKSVSLGKPTLEDVFLHVTGRRFAQPENVAV